MKYAGSSGALAVVKQEKAGMELREKWKCTDGKAMQHDALGLNCVVIRPC